MNYSGWIARRYKRCRLTITRTLPEFGFTPEAFPRLLRSRFGGCERRVFFVSRGLTTVRSDEKGQRQVSGTGSQTHVHKYSDRLPNKAKIEQSTRQPEMFFFYYTNK